MKTLIASLVAFAILFSSCSKETENESSSVTFQLKAKNDFSTVNRQQDVINWTTGYAYVSKVVLEAECGDDDDDDQGDNNSQGENEIRARFGTPVRVDLFTVLSTIGTITIPPCDYEEIEFKITLDSASGNAALELVGNYNSTPVILRINKRFVIEGEAENLHVTVGGNATIQTLLNLDLLAIGISAADLDAATRDASGRIVISADSNELLYRIMLNNLQDLEEVECD